MTMMTVTEAKAQLGSLVDAALSDEPVFIRRGDRVVQLVPAVQPDPIPVIAAGAFVRSPDEIAFLSAGSGDESEPFQR